jgi:predicted transposase/invertase (TIGR01784 family)
MMNNEDKNLPHDSLFKRIMEKDIAAKEFLDEHLPAEVKDIIDLDTIKVQKESYIEPNLTKRLSDIVYSVGTKDNQEAFIYIACEHQSSVDQLMAFRLWKYTLLLAERHLKDKGKIPLIFPLVVYAGKAKYTAPRNLWALFQNPELAKKLLTEDHALVDLQSMSDDEIIRKKHIALLEYVMKHVQMRDMLKLWQNIFEKLPEAVKIDKEHGYSYIKDLLWYVDGKLSIEKRDALSGLMIEHLPKNDGENIMQTIADSYREEGVNKGITQGIAIGKKDGIAIGEARGEAKGIEKRNVEIACRMLKEKTDIKFITSVTGLSIDEILKLQNSTQINQ